MKNKINISCELAYLVSIAVLSFAVAMASAANFGISMIVSPAFILSQKLSFLTFGQSEYVLQAIFFILFCIIMKKVKAVYFSSFVTCLIYGAVLDLWRLIIPVLNPDITKPGSMDMPVRIIFFALSIVLTSFSIALCFKSYLYPQVYDFFVKGVSAHFGINRTKFKWGFDASFLALSVVMSYLFFKKFIGVGVNYGTLIITAVNGPLIGLMGKLLDKFFVFTPTFKRFASHFEIE